MSWQKPSQHKPSGGSPRRRSGSVSASSAPRKRKAGSKDGRTPPAVPKPPAPPKHSYSLNTLWNVLRNGVSVWAGWARPARDGALAVYPAAALLGLAAGWQWSGIQTLLASVIDPLPATTTLVGAVALLTAALGPWLPERTVIGVARSIRQRSRRSADPTVDGTGTFWMLRAVRDRDASLLWLSLSVLASASAVVSLATLALTPVFMRFYQYLLDRFFWTDLTLAAVEWLGVALLIGPSWVILGVMAAAFAPVAGAGTASQRRPPGVVSGVLFGLGVAWLASTGWGGWGLSARQEFMAGVLVMFALAGVSAWQSQRTHRVRPVSGETEAAAPEVTPASEGLIWLLLVVWGVASVLVGSGWLACRSADVSAGRLSSGGLSWYILVTAAGMALASVHARQKRRSASGCGMAAWVSGVGGGAAATLTSYWPTGTVGAVAQILIVALPFGYALHYAERAWLARVGSETLGFAQLTSAILAGLGLGLIGVRWWALPMLGAMGLMTAGALLMLASGGLIQIYEEDRPIRTRHLRLALVFASLAGAIILFPSDAKRWAGWAREQQPAAPTELGLDWLAARELPAARRICLIGVDPMLAARWPAMGKAQVDIMPLLPESRTVATVSSAGGRTQILRTSAFRAFRMEPRRYDLIYQRNDASRCVGRLAEYSTEWLSRLAKHTLAGGRVIVDTPLAGLSADTVAVMAGTFEHAMEAPAVWTILDVDGQPAFRLAAVPGSAVPAPPDGPEPGCPVAWLLADRPDLRVHSIQRDGLTSALRTPTPQSVSSVLAWLQHCRAEGLAADGR